jgi:CelD/BcsL family acetyltransferase involved in cellulose biosynthesis
MLELALDDERWTAFVRGREEAGPFHNPAWSLLLRDCYGLPGFVLAVADADGEIAGGIPVLAAPRVPGRPRRWVSLPFTDSLTPLVQAADPARLAVELEAKLRSSGVARLELHGRLPGAHPVPSGAVVHTLALDPDPARVEARFSPAATRNARQGRQRGVSVRRAETSNDVATTYYGLHVDTRKRLGVPAQPRRFFRLLWSRILEPGLGFALIAERAGTPVAGAIFLHWNGTVVYKYGASDSAHWDLRPNNVLFLEAIRDSCRAGHRRLDFGRSELEAEGLRRFKRSWGAEESPLEYSVVGARPSGRARETGKALEPLLRRSPTWVTRTVGELLYRYAA